MYSPLEKVVVEIAHLALVNSTIHGPRAIANSLLGSWLGIMTHIEPDLEKLRELVILDLNETIDYLISFEKERHD